MVPSKRDNWAGAVVMALDTFKHERPLWSYFLRNVSAVVKGVEKLKIPKFDSVDFDDIMETIEFRGKYQETYILVHKLLSKKGSWHIF